MICMLYNLYFQCAMNKSDAQDGPDDITVMNFTLGEVPRTAMDTPMNTNCFSVMNLAHV